MSRTGANHRPHFEGGQVPLLRRIPKRGFNSPDHVTYCIVNVGALEEAFADGAVVDLAVLQEAGVVKKALDGLKILGDGNLTRKLTVKARAFSASAKAKIEAAGGTCEQL
jgi:large subunit ribosomal protein L15